jgi:hypothetical protein
MLVSMWAYVYGPFPLISRGLGGGKTRTIRLVIDPKYKDIVSATVVMDGATFTAPLILLEENDKSYFVEMIGPDAPSQNVKMLGTSEIGKDAVVAVIWNNVRLKMTP